MPPAGNWNGRGLAPEHTYSANLLDRRPLPARSRLTGTRPARDHGMEQAVHCPHSFGWCRVPGARVTRSWSDISWSDISSGISRPPGSWRARVSGSGAGPA